MTADPENGELVRVETVAVEYGSGAAGVAALADVSVVIRASERLVLWGPSGSGKTTLLQVLAGYTKPTDGRVWWMRPARVAMVFQGANLLPTFTVFENLAFAASVAGESQQRPPAAGDQLEELPQLVGLDSKRDALPSELSGGEQQRVAVARALAQRPSLLLCDEPTGHLDSDTGRRILDLIDALQGRLGYALVTATHDAGVAGRFDRALELVDGRVNEPAPALQQR
jgi:putative ABC transport system ATP-binding protein